LHLKHNCALGGIAIGVQSNNTGSSYEILNVGYYVSDSYRINYTRFLNGVNAPSCSSRILTQQNVLGGLLEVGLVKSYELLQTQEL